jgi:hypothetical protein
MSSAVPLLPLYTLMTLAGTILPFLLNSQLYGKEVLKTCKMFSPVYSTVSIVTLLTRKKHCFMNVCVFCNVAAM